LVFVASPVVTFQSNLQGSVPGLEVKLSGNFLISLITELQTIYTDTFALRSSLGSNAESIIYV
jgi:hypothetical protein